MHSRLKAGGATLLEIDEKKWLKLDSWVGVIETPCGTTLEILPKTHDDNADIGRSRAMLRKMIKALLDLPAKEAGVATLERFDVPLTEWVMERFLHALERLVQQGLRRDYQRIEEELPYLRGQLNVRNQVRQRPGHQHFFHVRHDVFLPNRPENRLLKLALDKVRKTTGHPDNWRLAQELSIRLHEIPASQQVQQDWHAWTNSRLMAHYQPIKPWCQLILGDGMPIALTGNDQGLSMLFPMQRLFEVYVARWLRQQLPADIELVVGSRKEHLCRHLSEPIFELRPDLLLKKRGGSNLQVLDTKWKRINAQDRRNKYGLSEGDFYQMLAYGIKYLNGQGSMVLIYPAWEKFKMQLPVFEIQNGLEVRVVPFDVEQDSLGGSPTSINELVQALLQIPTKNSGNH